MFTIPPKPVVLTTLKVTLLVWVVLRGFLASKNGSLSILPPVSVFLMLGVAVVAVMDVVVARERVLLANLGFGRRTIGGMAFLMAGGLEVISALLLFALNPGG